MRDEFERWRAQRKPGKRADLIVCSGDVLACPEEEMKDIRPLLTMVGGEIVYGRVPSGSVVVPGSLPSADGKYSLNCAVIVKRVDAQTRAKTSINELLRA